MVRFLCAMLSVVLFGIGAANAETYRLGYRAAILGGVEIGSANYDVTANARTYAVRSTLRTSGAASIFDQTQITATSQGAISGANIGWTEYDLSHAYAGKFRRIHMARGASGITASIEPRYGNMGSPETTTAQQRASYDPLSALFALGRQVGAAGACNGSVLVFDGRGHYRLEVTAKGSGNFNGGGYNGPAVSCNFTYTPIAGFNLSQAEIRQIPVAEAWFALPQGGGFAPPVRLTVPTPIGAAQLDLNSYERIN